MSRSDVLRRSSWRVASANTNRSTRGGTVSQSTTLQPKQMDAQTAKCAAHLHGRQQQMGCKKSPYK